MGPHQPGSQRSLSNGPDLPEAPTTCKWARRSYPQPWRPWKTPADLIQILTLGVQGKLLDRGPAPLVGLQIARYSL
jgi:hypothetical protein